MTGDHPEILLRLHAERSRRLRAEADAARLARSVRAPSPPRPELRTRLGWTLVEVGLRLVQKEHRRAVPRSQAA
ncbi:hypothetical protein ACWEFL_13825 [Streptomyces sp. NPDC004838]